VFKLVAFILPVVMSLKLVSVGCFPSIAILTLLYPAMLNAPEARTSLRHPTSSVESLSNADISGIVDRHSGYTRLCVLGIACKHIRPEPFSGSSKASITSTASVGFVRLLCLKSSNRIMDDDEVLLFVIVYSFPL
jgi:hypothetical protein